MSKIPAILSATLTVSLAACGGSDKTPAAPPVTTPVVTTEQGPTGALTIYNSTDGLFLTATADPGWEFTETRLLVTKSLNCIPCTRTGAPNVNRFMLRKKGKPAATEMAYNLPLLVEPGTELFIVLNASVRKIETPATDEGRGHGDCGDDENKTLTGWAQGTAFPGTSGAQYVRFTVQAPGAASLLGQYKTFTQTEWGSSVMSEAAPTYLTSSFPGAYPLGVTIGDSAGNTATFTSSAAVTSFLPQSGSNDMLTQRWRNPGDLRNPLAGEVLALTLNTGFDAFDAAFSASTSRLADLVVADPASLYYGLHVSEVLASANTLLSGRMDMLGATVEDALDAVNRINANFENGTADLGFLARQ